MSRKRFLVVRFEGQEQEPVWEEFDGQKLSRAIVPGGKSRLPVLALVPDQYFFFFHPDGLKITNERQLKAATLLQMSQLFPNRAEGQEREAINPGGGILGFISHPSLTEFMERHKAILEQASVITTPFVLVWSAAGADGTTVWTWRSEAGPAAVRANEQLIYLLRSDGDEYQARLNDAGGEDAVPTLTVLDGLAGIAKHGVPWQRLRLPLTALSASEVDVKPWKRAAVAAALAGLLFCVGQGLRYHEAAGLRSSMESSLQGLYKKALGQNPGSDPYGQLLYKISQLKGNKTKGVDALDLLASLSRASTGNLRVDNLSLSPDSGSIRGSIADYDSMEKLMKALNEQKGMNFTLEQAQNAEGGVQFSLRVSY